MTEITPRRPDAAVILPTVTGGHAAGLQVLREWVTAAAEAESLVAPLVDTAFLPASLWPLPPGVYPKEMPNPRIKHPRESVEEWQGRRQVACSSGVAAVLTGMTLGLDPLVALAQVYVVKGRPGLYTKIKVAIAQRAGHDIWDEEYTAERVTVCGRRKGWPEDRFVRITITIEDARRAGWTSNDTYAKTPADMLWSRAAGRVVDRIAGDDLYGIPTIETMDDDPAPVGQITAEAADLPAQASAAQILAATPPPPAADDAGPGLPTRKPTRQQFDAPPGPTVEKYVMPPSKRQLDAIGEAFAALKLNGRSAKDKAARLAVVTAVAGRTISDPRDLTGDEAAEAVRILTAEGAEEFVWNVLDPAAAARGVDEQDPPAPDVSDAAGSEQGTAPDDDDPYKHIDPSTGDGWKS